MSSGSTGGYLRPPHPTTTRSLLKILLWIVGYTIAIKVIDIFGNDTMTLVPVTVG